MNKIVWYIFLVCVVGCSPFATQFPGTINPQENTYTNDSLRLCLTIPLEWIIVNDRYTQTNVKPLLATPWLSKLVVGVTNPKRRAFGRLLVSSKDYTLNEYLKIVADHLSDDSTVTLADAKWSVDGMDTSAMLEYIVCKKGRIKDRYFELLFENAGHVMRLQFWTLSALYDDYRPMFYSTVRQITLNKGLSSVRMPWNREDSLMFGNSIPFINVQRSPSLLEPYGNPCIDTNRSLCWKITSQSNTVYILGSIHLAKPEIYPLKPSVENAFAGCKVLALEVNSESASFKKEMNKVVRKARYPMGESIKSHLSEETYLNLKKAMKSVGMTTSLFEVFHPWLLGQIITQMKYKQMGITHEYGLEQHFLKKANDPKDKKEVVELENGADHIKLFQDFCNNELFLAYTLFGLDQQEKQIVPILAAWKCGNVDLIEQLVLKEDIDLHPEFEHFAEKLIHERNRKMVDKICGYLSDNRDYFVIFGSGHAVGPKGVIALLAEKGYKIEQL